MRLTGKVKKQVLHMRLTVDIHQWRRKFAKSGGAILLKRKYFYGKKLNPMEYP